VAIPGGAHAASMTHPEVIAGPLADFLARYGQD